MTFLGVCKLAFLLAFLYVLYSYVLENVPIYQFGHLEATWVFMGNSWGTSGWLCAKCHVPRSFLKLSVWNFAHTLLPSCGHQIASSFLAECDLSLAFLRWWYKKTVGFIFVFSFTRSNVLYSPIFISHFHKLQSVTFQIISIIGISLLKCLSYRQLDLGISF